MSDLVRKAHTAKVEVADAAEGIVDAIVGATEVPDMQGDIIKSGAFAASLARRKPKGLAGHDWLRPVAKTIEAEEIKPGDASLPEPWQSEGAGAVRVLGQYHLAEEDEEARREFARVKFFGPEQEWSVGFFVLDAEPQDGLTAVRAIDWIEWSSVVAGAQPLTGVMAVKAQIVRPATVDHLADRISEILRRYGEERTVEVVERVLDAIDRPFLDRADRLLDLLAREKYRPEVEAFCEFLSRAMPQGAEHKELAAIPPHETPVTDQGEWDGPEMVARCPAERDALRALHAWVDPEADPDTKAAYKLPHHVVSTSGDVGAAHIQGVRAALAVLSGARGGANIPDGDVPGVREHLDRHVRDWENKVLAERVAKIRALREAVG